VRCITGSIAELLLLNVFAGGVPFFTGGIPFFTGGVPSLAPPLTDRLEAENFGDAKEDKAEEAMGWLLWKRALEEMGLAGDDWGCVVDPKEPFSPASLPAGKGERRWRVRWRDA
jgi:hypothetical protein